LIIFVNLNYNFDYYIGGKNKKYVEIFNKLVQRSNVDLVELHNIKPPTLVVIGDVINTFDEKHLTNLGYLSHK